ncbi:MAG: MarR family winged helix-turn-helix transcriptional regulator [Chloroflexota bacterium]
MKDELLAALAEDLFSVPALVVRASRRKLLKTAAASVDESITPLHFGVMKALSEAGPLHASAVSDMLQIPGPQMTRLADRLVAAGLVDRQPDPADRRSINLALSEKGTMVIEQRSAAIRESVKEALSSVSEEELQELSNSLRTLRDFFSRLQ